MSPETETSDPARWVGAQILTSAAVLGTLAARGVDLGAWLAGPWGAPFVVVNLGVGAALWFAGRLPAASAEVRAVARSGRRRDLELSRALVVDQLRQLEIERPKLSDDDYTRERDALLAVGARALEALESDAVPTDGDAGAGLAALVERLRALRAEVGVEAWSEALTRLDPAPARSGAGWAGLAWAAAALVVLAVLGTSASEQARDRAEGAPMTGGDMASGPGDGGEAQIDEAARAERAALEAKLAEKPGDIVTLNALTEAAIGERDLGGAMKYNQAAMEAAPADPDARTYKAVLAAFVGMSDRALDLLDEIVKDHPDHLKAWVYKGLVSIEAGRNADAVTALERAIALGGPQPILTSALARAKGAVERPFPTAQLTDPPGEAPPAAAAGDVIAAGTLEYGGPSPAADRVLWLSVRDPAGGPPLAAKRLPAGPFPMRFEITAADRVQMGGARPLPANVAVTARIGGSDPMSRTPNDPSASVTVTPGTSDLALRIGE